MRLTFALLLMLLPVSRLAAGFSSIYVFGDGVCTTTDSPTTPSLYYGPGPGQKRWSNGPVWIEKISQLQGITYNAAKNKSYFGHTSAALIDPAESRSVINFSAADSATALFIVWTNNADFVDFQNDGSLLWQSSSQAAWNTKITNAINNLTTAINTLYAKGARKFVMPNAVNIAAAPYITRPAEQESFFRDRVVQYNSQFQIATTNLMNTKPGLVIYRPDVFSYLEQVIANPVSNGFTNVTAAAIGEPLYATLANGLGTDYLFWDYWHPTTKFHELLADFVNQSVPDPDTTPPVLTLPGNLVLEATDPGGAVVTFATSAHDAVDGSTPTHNTPPSGSTFPVGTTTVQVSASDSAGNTADGSFTVSVVDMRTLLQNVAMIPAGDGLPGISGQIHGGPPHGQVVLQASMDLGVGDPWRDIATIPLDATGSQSFGPVHDPEGSGALRCFFRIKLPLSP